jgi:holo-[acyl-carrier protein] synthase
LIRGLGTDVVEMARVEAAIRRHGRRFLERVLAAEERDLASEYESGRLVEFVAGRFAAKEAIAKALGCGLGALGMASVAVLPTPRGLAVSWHGSHRAANHARDRWWVSISHTRTTAFAVAIWETVGSGASYAATDGPS